MQLNYYFIALKFYIEQALRKGNWAASVNIPIVTFLRMFFFICS